MELKIMKKISFLIIFACLYCHDLQATMQPIIPRETGASSGETLKSGADKINANFAEHEAEINALSAQKADKTSIPTALADLASDSAHRTLTDAKIAEIGNQTTVTGNAGTATKLQTARTIGGVSFDGSANINLPGVNATGNQNTTGNAATATALQTPQAASATPFSATSGISATTVQGAIEEVKAESTVPTGSTGQVPVYNSSGAQVATTPLTPVAGSNITLTTDNTAGTFTIASTASGGGYTNLTSFVDQTAWRLFYSDGSGDVKELGLGVSGQVLKSQGASAVPVWSTDNTSSGTGYVSTVPTYSDSACTDGQYALDSGYRYDCLGNAWSKTARSAWSNPAPSTYSLTIDGTGWNGTDSVTVGGSTYTADGVKTGLSGATAVTVTPGSGRTATVSGAGITGSSSPYSADMSADRTMNITFAASVGGGAAFSSGAVESFETGSGLFDTSGWSETDTHTSINTFDSTYTGRCGTHQLKINAAYANTGDKLVVDLGSSDSDYYITWYMDARSVFRWYSKTNLINFTDDSSGTNWAAGVNFRVGGDDSPPNTYVSLNRSDGTVTYYLNETTGIYRFDMHVKVGALGETNLKLAHWNGSSWTQQLTNTGSDVLNGPINGFASRYMIILPQNDNTESGIINTIYLDGFKVNMSGSNYIGDITCP